MYSGEEFTPIGYTDLDFPLDPDFKKSTSSSILTLGGGAIIWWSIKQSYIADSTMKVEYEVICEAAKEAIWLHKFLMDL